MIAKNLTITMDLHGNPLLSFQLTNKTDVEAIQSLAECELLEVTVKKFRKKRSLTANGALWLLLDRLARKLQTSKDELYLHFLEQYGTFTHLIVKPDAVDKIKKEWRTVREIGEIKVNGKIGIQLQCYYGSSTMNSEEFSRLLQGVIDECNEQGIEAITPLEVSHLLSLIDNIPN